MVLKGLDPGVEKKTVSEGVKPMKTLPKKICDLGIHIKNTFCKKNWAKTVNLAFSSGQSNLPPSYMGSQPPTR